MLSDRDILAAIEAHDLSVDPFDVHLLQPASVDVRLFDQFVYPDDEDTSVRTRSELVLWPGDFVLASTLEVIDLSPRICARFEGKSTLGRRGLLTHVTAGFIDPGWHGRITLELANISRRPITLRRGDRVGQLSFSYLHSPALHPYGSQVLGSHYQGDMGPERSALDR